MKVHKEIETLIEKLQAGELTPAEEKQLKAYTDQYPEYKEIVHTHQFLLESGFPVADPEAEEFDRMRARVMQHIRMGEFKEPGFFQQLFETITTYIQRPEMAIAALTLIIGFFLGRALPPSDSRLQSEIVDQMSVMASENTKLSDVQKSPYAYSNISFNEIDSKRISLSFDVTTHLDVVSEKGDPLVREVMAQSLLNPTNVGTDLKVISYTKGTFDTKIKEALVFSLKNAPIMAVRLKSMEQLSNYGNDQEIQMAFVDVLRQEESVKMRLLAIDFLTKNNFSSDSLKRALSESTVPQSPAVMIKLKKYIEQK
ncbi:MAG: hypothetical protein E4H13_11545 [Calditrichales bacterium]|nr:MAG: hypothetical protein E4H13_11545 [Calditrichales bacterium]